jgi:hypothetical protein
MVIALKSLYPATEWSHILRSRGFLSLSKQEQQERLNKIGEKMGVTKLEDWYRMTTADVIKNGGKSIVSRFNNSLIQSTGVV